MHRTLKIALASSLLTIVSAQSSNATVTQVLIPIADQQPLGASVLGQTGDVKTLVIECTPGTPSEDCGFPEPITITAGPSTFHYSPTGIYEILGEIDCKITGTTEAFCSATAPLYDTASLATAGDYESITTPALSSSTTSATLTGSDLIWISVTITAGEVSGASSTASSTASTGRITSTDSASTSRSRSATTTGTTSSATSSATNNAAVGSSGLAYSGAMAALLALPIILV